MKLVPVRQEIRDSLWNDVWWAVREKVLPDIYSKSLTKIEDKLRRKTDTLRVTDL